MAVEIPGLSLSILRQETRIQPGRPLLISGRFTAFGLGVPALIRVSLEGPSYDPQIRSFDTFASPFSGDYTVNVIAEKGGSYQVYAQAFPPPLIPTGPPFPEVLLLLPPIAESTHPPLVVGGFTDTGIDYLLPDGTSRFLDAPPQQPIEFRPIITVAPGVTVTAPGVPAAMVPALAPPAYPPAPPAPPVAPPERITAALEDIRMSPEEINPGQEATGVVSWRNTSPVFHSFDVVIYTIDQRGVRHGPVQLESGLSVSPQVPQITNLRFGTEGLPSGSYSIQGEIYDSVTGILVGSGVIPYRLRIREIAPPIVPPPLPPAPPVVPPPEVPAVPTADILSQPTLNLLREIRVGDTWSGSVSLPTLGAAPYYIAAQLVLVDPAGREIVAGEAGRILQPAETLSIPVNLNTTNFTPGTYNILLRIVDQYGALLWEFPMGFLSLLEAIAPPPLPPAVPPAPTADMIQTPFVNLPSTVTHGEIWQGDIRVPTVWPVTLPEVPGVPSYNINALLQLESPVGQRFDVERISTTFTPGRDISIPAISFDTSVLPEAATYNVLLNLTDFQGRDIFDFELPPLGVLPAPPLPPVPPEIPVPPPEIPVLSEFTAIEINLGPSEVQVGESIDIPIRYTHVGQSEVVIIRASIGDLIAGVHFDEVWGEEQSVPVPADLTPTTRDITITIPITPKFQAAGIYTVEAKVDHWAPRVLARLPNLVAVIEVPAPPAPPPIIPVRADIRNLDFAAATGTYEIGDNVPFTVNYEYKGRAQRGQIVLSLGTGVAPTFIPVANYAPMPIDFGEASDWVSRSYSGTFALTEALEAGRLYNTRARLEALEEPTQETDTDWSVIQIAAPPELPPSTFPGCTVVLGRQRVTYGDTVNIPVYFSHYGGKEMVRIYAAIGTWHRDWFDEVLHGETDWSVPDEMDQRTRTVTIPISITRAISPGTYDVYGKVMRVQTGRGEIVSDPVQNVIEVYEEVAVGPSQFSNVTVAYPTAPVSIGGSVSLQVNFMHQGEAESEWLYAAIGNDGVFGFDEILYNRKVIAVPAEAEATFHSETIDIPVTTAIRPGTYDVYAKIGLGVRPRAISPTSHDVIRITS